MQIYPKAISLACVDQENLALSLANLENMPIGRFCLCYDDEIMAKSIPPLLQEKQESLTFLCAKDKYLLSLKTLLENFEQQDDLSRLNARDTDGMTALSYASVSGHIEIAKISLERGIHIEAKKEFGETALR